MSIAAEKSGDQHRRLLRTDAGAAGELTAPRGATRGDLRWSVADAAAYSVMVGVGEAYLPAFALALGMGDVLSGMVATVPMLCGAVLQMSAPWAVRRAGSHRRWVVGCAAVQGLSLLVLPWAVMAPAAAVWLVYLAATVYWASGLATGPAWNTWIESIVPRRLRPRFFGRRSRIAHAAVLCGFLAGGLALEAGKGHGVVLATFASLFCLAAVCRFGSAMFLARHREPHLGRLTDRRVGWGEMLGRVRGEASGRLLVYLLAMQVAVQMSGPYFVPYMLSELKLSYFDFTLLVGLAFIGKLTMLPLWGRFAEAVEARGLLVVCGLAIVPLSSLWLVSDRLAYLMVLQFCAGAVWAGLELAMLLMFFEAIPKEERTSVLTVYNLGSAAAMVAGTVLGGALLAFCGESRTGYMLIFGLSGVARLLTLGLLFRVRAVTLEPATASTRTVAVRASSGSIEAPIVPALDSAAASIACCTVAVEASQ